VRQGIAEVDEQAIAEILRDMALKAGDHLGTGVLIGPHHLPEVFRVKLTGEGSRIHQVTKQHGELPAFGFRCGQASRGPYGLRRLGGLRVRQRSGRRRGEADGRDARVFRPDQATPRVVGHLRLRVEQFVLQGR